MKYLFGSLLILSSMGLFSQENEFARPDLPGELMVDIGFSLWSETVGDLDQEVWPSKSIGIYYLKTKKLNEKFRFNYGAGFTMDKIGFKTNQDTLAGTSNYLALTADIAGDYSFSTDSASANNVIFNKYSLKNTFFEIPVELRFHPKGSEEGEGFFISLGGMVGLRMKSKDKLVYDLNGEKYKSKNSGDFGVNNFRYGVQARLGFRGVHLFYKQYFNNVFKDDFSVNTYGDPTGQTFNPKMVTFGINITGF